RARKRIGSAKATAAQDRLIALVERGIVAVVVEALIGIGRAPASAGPRRLAPWRARPALGVSVGEQQSHHCDGKPNKTDRANAGLRVSSGRLRRPRGLAQDNIPSQGLLRCGISIRRMSALGHWKGAVS